MNSAVIKVVYPDGMRGQWKTRPTGPHATDLLAFAEWLGKLADELKDAAKTMGKEG